MKHLVRFAVGAAVVSALVGWCWFGPTLPPTPRWLEGTALTVIFLWAVYSVGEWLLRGKTLFGRKF